MHQPCQQCVGLSVRAIVFLCNSIQKFLHFNPLFTWNKAFMPSDRNNPLANRLAFNGLNIFWRDKCAVTAFILFLIGFIVSRQSVSFVKLCHVSKHIAVMVDEIIIAAFISSTIDRISQNQSCGGCVKCSTGRSVKSFLIHLLCSGLDTASGSKNFIQSLNHTFFFWQTF